MGHTTILAARIACSFCCFVRIAPKATEFNGFFELGLEVGTPLRPMLVEQTPKALPGVAADKDVFAPGQ